jgi:hypothetical protein
MARARNIKPGFFKNEDLGTADPYVSLLFAGLWTLADKAGILEDRPLRIKAELFPYRDGFDINGYLTVLVTLKLIHRYEVGGVKYIQVINFEKHQNPHHTEKNSEFPSYSESCKLTDKQPLINGDTPSDSLIPDSLNTDSSITDSQIPEVSAEKTSAPKLQGKSLAKDWKLPKAWGEWALSERQDLTAEQVRKIADEFKDYWLSIANQAKAKRADWEATWRNWIRKQNTSSKGYQTKGERIAANNEKAFEEFLNETNETNETIIEGEVVND